MISDLIQHSLDYFVRLGKKLILYGVKYVAGIFRTKLSWNNIVPGNMYWLSSFVLCLAIFAAEKTPEMTIKTRAMMAGMSIPCVMIVFLMLYVWWTPMDSAGIQGFQGRYLLPLTLPVILAVKPPQWYKEKLIPYLMGATALVNIGFLIRIVQHVAG